MGEVDAAADILTGGILANAVDPAERAPGRDGHSDESHCLNCATPLVGRHCHRCGQAAHVHRTLGAFFHDLAHGILHVDGKLWRTIGLLVWHPGHLTRRYIEGERAKFVSPIALFLFSVFLTFGIISLTSGQMVTIDKPSIERDIAKEQKRIDALEKTLNRDPISPAKSARIRRELDERQADLRMLKDMQVNGVSSATMKRANVDLPDDQLPFGLGPQIAHIRENPQLFAFKVQSSAYKFSWLLIPISVPFLWLLFPFSRRFRLYDHTVFVTYSLAFMTLAVTIIILVGTLGWGLLAAAVIFYLPFHLFRQLKESYQLTRVGALLRTSILSLFALTAAILFGLAITLLSL